MQVKNRLREILQELGIKSMIPTTTALREKLGGMSLIRFNKLLNNAGPRDIRLHEVQLLTTWLAEITGRPKSAVKVLKMESEEAPIC